MIYDGGPFNDARTRFLAEQRVAFTAFRPNSFAIVTGLDLPGRRRYTPLWTRHMRGVIELERDQRRRRHGR